MDLSRRTRLHDKVFITFDLRAEKTIIVFKIVCGGGPPQRVWNKNRKALAPGASGQMVD
jgi:hypothetical protein